MQHIIRSHSQRGADFLDADLAPTLDQQVYDHLLPVRTITEQTEIREWFLRTSELVLALTELVAESDEEFPVALALELWEREDACHVVALETLFLFAEVADEMVAVGVAVGHAVEEERVDVVVECFVVEEEFAQEAEVPAPGSLPSSVDLEETDVVVAVDLIAWWMHECAFGSMTFELVLIAVV